MSKVRTTHTNRAAWEECAQKSTVHFKQKFETWNAELDSHLFFSALFSGIIATFAVATYPLLQPSHPDASLLLLAQISAQLSSLTVNNVFINATQPSMSFSHAIEYTNQTAPASIVVVNVLLFASLVVALGAAAVCIECKQWLRYIESNLHGKSLETNLLREYRRSHIYKWRVEDIIANIPPTLDISITTFFLAVVILAWTLHPAVAAVSTVLVLILFAFQAFTIVAPSLHDDCPFVTPQARHFFGYVNSLARASSKFRGFLEFLRTHVKPPTAKSGTTSLRRVVANTATWGDYEFWSQREQRRLAFWGDALKEGMLIKAAANDVNFLHTDVLRQCARSLPISRLLHICDVLWDSQNTVFGRRTPLVWPVYLDQTRLALHYLDLEALHRLKSPVNDEAEQEEEEEEDDPEGSAVRILKRMLRIGEVWPTDPEDRIDKLFFPTIAAYAQLEDDRGALAFAVLRNSVTRNEYLSPDLGISSGVEKVMTAIECMASRRHAESYRQFFPCCTMSLHVLRTKTVTSDDTHRLLQRTRTLFSSLTTMLQTPLWRQWVYDKEAFRECVDMIYALRDFSMDGEFPGRTLVTMELLDAFEVVLAKVDWEDQAAADGDFGKWTAWASRDVDDLRHLIVTSGSRRSELYPAIPVTPFRTE